MCDGERETERDRRHTIEEDAVAGLGEVLRDGAGARSLCTGEANTQKGCPAVEVGCVRDVRLERHDSRPATPEPTGFPTTMNESGLRFASRASPCGGAHATGRRGGHRRLSAAVQAVGFGSTPAVRACLEREGQRAAVATAGLCAGDPCRCSLYLPPANCMGRAQPSTAGPGRSSPCWARAGAGSGSGGEGLQSG